MPKLSNMASLILKVIGIFKLNRIKKTFDRAKGFKYKIRLNVVVGYYPK